MNPIYINPNKRFPRIKIWHTKVLLCVIALIIAYLFALNGRFTKVDDEYYFDKWTKTMLEIRKFEVVE